VLGYEVGKWNVLLYFYLAVRSSNACSVAFWYGIKMLFIMFAVFALLFWVLCFSWLIMALYGRFKAESADTIECLCAVYEVGSSTLELFFLRYSCATTRFLVALASDGSTSDFALILLMLSSRKIVRGEGFVILLGRVVW
jgi:hypothetical protein